MGQICPGGGTNLHLYFSRPIVRLKCVQRVGSHFNKDCLGARGGGVRNEVQPLPGIIYGIALSDARRV